MNFPSARNLYSLCSAAILLLTWTLSPAAAVEVVTRVVAISGDPAPDGNGVFSFFDEPTLNDAGQIAFRGSLTGTNGGSGDNTGLFRAGGMDRLVQIAREGQIASDGNGSLLLTEDFALNNAGQVAYVGVFTNGRVIYRSEGSSGVVPIARQGDVAPDGNGSFRSFDKLALNDAGEVVFEGIHNGTINGLNDNRGIYVGDGSSSAVQVIREGDPAPDGIGTIDFTGLPLLNEAGQVAFLSGLSDTVGGFSDNLVIFRWDWTSGLRQIVRRGQVAPDGNENGKLSLIDTPVLNDGGEVAFLSSLTNTSGGGRDNSGIFRAGGASGLVQIVREGDVPPDGNGSFLDFRDPTLNSDGQTAFVGGLSGTGGEIGIYRGDGTSSPIEIARYGQATPDGNGTFVFFDKPALNDAGQVAFLARYANSRRGSSALYLYDDLIGLTRVARLGDPLLGSSLAGLDFLSSDETGSPGQSGLNEHGQIVYQFRLDDGRTGIAIATIVPEPTTVALCLAAVGCLFARRRAWGL